MRHLSSATSWLRQALGMMERRKSLIALPLNPPPGCYNLPPFLPPSPSPTPSSLRSSYSPLSISPEAASLRLHPAFLSPLHRLIRCTAALCGSSITGHSNKETWTPLPDRSPWFVTRYQVSELYSLLTNDLIIPETVGGKCLFWGGCKDTAPKEILSKSIQKYGWSFCTTRDRNGYLVSIFSKWAFN